jgi:hypothetical protein
LLDPEYLAFIIDSVDSFMQNKGPYLEEQIRLNLAIENVLLRYVRLGETTGKLALQGRINESEIPKDSYKILTTTSGVSTSYYS